jgi:tungstate transport system ATP-binding protein
MNLRFEDLRRRYGEKLVLDLGHGQVDDGKITGIVGPRGAGKSTLLDIIVGLEKPSGGRLMYGSYDVSNRQFFSEDVPHEQIAAPFQRPSRTHRTVEGGITHALKLRELSAERIKARTSELMDELGLTALAKRRGWQLSDDETLKVLFARALALSPELLLIDEPPVALSDATIIAMERLIKRENAERGMTVLLVCSNPAQAQKLCDELIFMRQGRIVARGKTAEMLTRPVWAEMWS